MENEFNFFLHDMENSVSEKPESIEEVGKKYGFHGDPSVERCRQLQKDMAAPRQRDPFEIDEILMKARIEREIKNGAGASSAPVAKAEPDLMHLLDIERPEPSLGQLLGKFERVPVGRVTVRPPNLESGSTSEVFEAVAAHCPDEGGRRFAKRLAGMARELEG
jgi:hypothetical protein